MKKILVLVEGPTEETFVRELLDPYLQARGACAVAKILVTKVTRQGTQYKGGVGSYAKFRRDVSRLLGDTSAAIITTMLDYNGLPADFPGMDSRPPGPTAYDRVQHVEAAVACEVRHPRFLPHLTLHEFEAFLFVEPECFGWWPAAPVALRLAVERAGGAELVNEGADSAPSKRLHAFFPGYGKLVHGPAAARRLGMTKLRERCPHFGRWVRDLEGT